MEKKQMTSPWLKYPLIFKSFNPNADNHNPQGLVFISPFQGSIMQGHYFRGLTPTVIDISPLRG